MKKKDANWDQKADKLFRLKVQEQVENFTVPEKEVKIFKY